MPRDPGSVVVAGHICLDVIPSLQARGDGVKNLLIPGKLVDTGPALLSTGGAVSNTGIALHRLGIQTKLMGKVGDDLFGQAVLQIVNRLSPDLAQSMVVASGEASSYTIVISPPGVDRIFLHCTGANDTFGARDLKEDVLSRSCLFHFGYPPLMRQMYADGGGQLMQVMKTAKGLGLTTSLDMAKPDPDSEAGSADWKGILKEALPFVDLFLPSFDEIVFMLRRDLYEQLLTEAGGSDIVSLADSKLLCSLADELLEMGTAVVAIKLGEHGLYVKTSSDVLRWRSLGAAGPEEADSWLARELYVPCFKVEVAGTTGAGDCTIAGFLAGWLYGLSPEETVLGAVGVGASNVERPDAVSGIRSWTEIRERMRNGWEQHPLKIAIPGFRRLNNGVWSA